MADSGQKIQCKSCTEVRIVCLFLSEFILVQNTQTAEMKDFKKSILTTSKESFQKEVIVIHLMMNCNELK
jgi:hypothetical protein